MKLSIELPDGKIIHRKAYAKSLGNFCMLSVLYKGIRFAIGDGDEYMRGMPTSFRLNYPLGAAKQITGKGVPYVRYPDSEETKYTKYYDLEELVLMYKPTKGVVKNSC